MMRICMTAMVVWLLFVSGVFSGLADADGDGLFRSIPADSPKKGILRLTNVSFYSKVPVNDVLKTKYGVTKSRIMSSINDVEYGISNSLALTGTLPYYADFFSQGSNKGEKTGGGDIAAGMRFSYMPEKSFIRGMSLGSRMLIPERMVYGKEPLGFRNFTSGEFGLSFEASAGFGLKFLDTYFSAAMQAFPRASQPDSAYSSDYFYETGFGYRGIGINDESGYPSSLFHNQLHLTCAGIVPFRSWLAGFLEFSRTSFLSGPVRDPIVRLAPGVRIGSIDRINASIGIDFGISGDIPGRTVQFRLSFPSLSRRSLKKPMEAIQKIRRIPGQGEQARAQNSFLAVQSFSKSDFTYLYENELRDSFQKQLQSLGVLNVVPGDQVDTVFRQKALAPLPEKTAELGVRLGAGYLIKTDIFEYSISRTTGFIIPLVVGFPGTNFSIKARATVTDLVTGQTHDLGVVSATVVQPRGVRFFPLGASSDIVYLSEPEQRMVEKKLIDLWVTNFNKQIFDRIDLFDWDPKRIIVRGDEEISG